MKNIHLIPTDKPSRLLYFGTSKELTLQVNPATFRTFERSTQNIYITSDEEIKDLRPHKGKWQLEKGQILNKFPNYLTDLSECKLVILTTDQDLIKDGVQAIDNEFLEWFVKNPSCEEVKVDKNWNYPLDKSWEYKIIIPKEEPKQFSMDADLYEKTWIVLPELSKPETLEEAAERLAMDKLKNKWEHLYIFGYPQKPFPTNYENDLNNVKVGLYEGAKYQAERMYSEEEVEKLIIDFLFSKGIGREVENVKEWFKQFKKK